MSVTNRLVSLDVLRGMTIMLMILVNTPGSWSYVYAPLRHAEWHGCTPTDLVFPFFLFIVGVSMWFSFSKSDAGLNKVVSLKILKRTLIIFIIGLLLNLFPYFNFSELRIMGVLQRIALAYGVGAFICIYFRKTGLLIFLLILLFGYWALLYFGAPSDPYALENNLVRTLDLALFGPDHVYKGFGIPFDPEGLLSTLPAVGTVIIGYLTGHLLTKEKQILMKVKKLLIYGSLLTIAGLIWGLAFPINKALWTSSYVLFTAGLGMLLLSVLIYLIDYKSYKSWIMPFIHFGTNPLFIFVLSGLYVKTIASLITFSVRGTEEKVSAYSYLFTEVFLPIAGPMIGSLLFAVTHIVFFWWICYLLYKRKIFIKI